jgi:transposase
MEIVVERVAGLEVHKSSVIACARVPAESGGRQEHMQTFASNVPSLLVLSDWLDVHGVTQVAMEATGVHWMPAWAILEDCFACTLVEERDAKQLPGREPDVTQAQWLSRLAEAGLLQASLTPPKGIGTLRNVTGYRRAQIRERQDEAWRLHRFLEDSGIKPQSIASGAELSHGNLCDKLPGLLEALQGRLDSGHAVVVGRIIAHIDYLDEAIAELSAAVEDQVAPLAAAVEALQALPECAEEPNRDR